MSQWKRTTPKRRTRSREDIFRICEESFNKATSFGNQVAHALWEYNAQIADYAKAIRKAQPRTHGAVLLQLDPCGKGCCACPHPRWVKWVNRNAQNPKAAPTWFMTYITKPGTAARAKHIPQEARQLIRQAQSIVQRRARLVTEFARFQKVVAGHIQYDPSLAVPPQSDA